MGILFAILAACLVALSNYYLRRSIDAGGTTKGYLVVQVSLAFFIMILLNPVRTGEYSWSTWVCCVGIFGGVLFGFLMWGLGKTLEKGPASLTFAVLNTSAVMPAALLALIFGSGYGHVYTFSNGLGSALVVIGLVWAGWTSNSNPSKREWLLFCAFIFILHVAFLVYLQWWALVLKHPFPDFWFVPFNLVEVSSEWFMPSILFVGALIQWLIFWKQKKMFPRKMEISYGFFGGLANGAGMFFLILAPQKAHTWENAMIFPIFCVGIIFICNVWAQVLYKEKVNWWANSLCLLGLFIGTLSFN